MADVREDILARLFEVVATIPSIVSAHRNKAISDDTELPTVIVFDGDEETNDAGNRRSNSPMTVEMTPEIVFAQEADNIGTDLTTLRRELIKLVLYDTTLNDLVAKSSPRGEGAIRYLGCVTNISTARSPYGALIARFMFKYTLKPDEL